MVNPVKRNTVRSHECISGPAHIRLRPDRSFLQGLRIPHVFLIGVIVKRLDPDTPGCFVLFRTVRRKQPRSPVEGKGCEDHTGTEYTTILVDQPSEPGKNLFALWIGGGKKIRQSPGLAHVLPKMFVNFAGHPGCCIDGLHLCLLNERIFIREVPVDMDHGKSKTSQGDEEDNPEKNLLRWPPKTDSLVHVVHVRVTVVQIRGKCNSNFTATPGEDNGVAMGYAMEFSPVSDRGSSYGDGMDSRRCSILMHRS